MPELRDGSVNRWLDTMEKEQHWSCGCCGRPIGSDDEDWCDDCLPHLRPITDSPGPWDRTWFSQYGEDCLFQVGIADE